MDQQSTRTDITVNVDGFWMLQALLDIRHVAPELRCRPYVSTDSNDWLNEHPGMAVMREQGIVVNDAVNEQVAARMKVLAAPDLEVVALLSRGKLLYGVIDDENQPPGSRDILTMSSGWCWPGEASTGCRRYGLAMTSPSMT